jgi:hypothetical protein
MTTTREHGFAFWGAWGLWLILRESQQIHAEATSKTERSATSEAPDA